MKRIARLIGLFTTFLLLFMAAVLFGQHSLRKHTAQLREETLETKREQMLAVIGLARIGPPPWQAEIHRGVEEALGAEIRPANDTSPAGRDLRWRFSHTFADAPDRPTLEISFIPPPAVRLLATYQRTAAALLTLALCLLLLFGAYLFWNLRAGSHAAEPASAAPDHARADLRSLQHLASVSARQGDELERERAERLRVEENLHIKQLLLTRALEQRIRLGQDLHDGIIQSLYATGLTLEAARPLVATDPAAAAARIAESTQALNTTIREVRAYINGLSPDTLRRQTFPAAVAVLTRELAADRTVRFDLRIDESAAAALPEETATDLLQVVRECVSNSLRHGRATGIQISLTPCEAGSRLVIADDGAGFIPARRRASGHGLENIEARTARHAGAVSIESAPGRGTTITCTLPAAPVP